jgi:hypothetical protein
VLRNSLVYKACKTGDEKMKVRLSVEDDAGRTYEGELVLTKTAGNSKTRHSAKLKASSVPSSPKKPSDALKALHVGGVFASERNLGAVELALANIHCNFPKASLAKALERAPFLTRRGKRGNFRWIQRFKPGV